MLHGCTQANWSGHRENDVRTLLDEVLGQLLAFRLVFETTGERSGGRLVLVPTEDLDVGAVLLVVVLHTSQ